MTYRFQILLTAMICLIVFACNKHEIGSPTPVRLKKLITNGADSLGNLCNSCLQYEMFNYDQDGKLISITDSVSNWLLFYDGPHPYTGGYSNRFQTFQYDIQGRLIRSGTDSFVYNNGNQIIKRYRQSFSDPSRSFYINSYTYDTNGRLMIDSSFTDKTIANPAERIFTSYILYSYDNNNNVIKQDWVKLFQGNARHDVFTTQYDNNPNPVKNFAFVLYMVGVDPPVISANNVSKPGYVYEYYSNGYLKKISYQGFIQEYFYE